MSESVFSWVLPCRWRITLSYHIILHHKNFILGGYKIGKEKAYILSGQSQGIHCLPDDCLPRSHVLHGLCT